MLQVVWTLLAGLAVFALVVIIHEWAHFFVARRCGIGTECFSIGFGPTLCAWKGRDGTVYRIAAIPLGGYVKMKGGVNDAHKRDNLAPDAFYAKPIWQRMLVILAGPVSNFILAGFIFWLLLWNGQTIIKPVVGAVQANSIAAQAGLQRGDEFLRIGGQTTSNWQQVILQLATHLGDAAALPVQVLRNAHVISATGMELRPVTLPPHPLQHELLLHVQHWRQDDLSPQPLQSLGLSPYHPPIPLRVDRVLADSPAAYAGLQVGDRLLAVNGQRLHNWHQIDQLVNANLKKGFELSIMRQRQKLQVHINLAASSQDLPSVENKPLHLGVEAFALPWPHSMLIQQHYSPWQQIGVAGQQVWFYSAMNAKVLWRLLNGHLSVKSLGGPIMVFQSAGQAASAGWKVYLHLVAMVSLIVGFFNLLPIPMVDGGVFVFQVIEWVRAKPAPLWLQQTSSYLGFGLLIYLFLQASMNDLLRFF